MNPPIPIDTRARRNSSGTSVQPTATPKYVRLASGRAVLLRVVEMVIVAARDAWADGRGAQLIDTLRLRFVGLSRDELTEIVWGRALEVEAENAAYRTHLASAAEVAHQARMGVWWPDAA